MFDTGELSELPITSSANQNADLVRRTLKKNYYFNEDVAKVRSDLTT